MQKRDPHQTLRIQAKIDVFIQIQQRNIQNTCKNDIPKNMKNGGFGKIFRGQKSSKMMIFRNMKNMKKAWQAQQI